MVQPSDAVTMEPHSHNDIYAVPVLGHYLIYAPLRQVAALVNGAALKKIHQHVTSENGRQGLDDSHHSLFAKLTKPAVTLPEARQPFPEPPFLGIIPSRACNMSCAYCDFGSKTAPKERMPLDMAVAAVDWMADHVRQKGRRELEIHLFGGEPLVEDRIVAAVVHRGRMLAGAMGLVPHFEVSTNGLFDQTMAQFVGDYFNTTVLSLDGFEPAHDRHRPINRHTGSFAAVAQTARRLSGLPTHLCLRCCVSQANVAQLEDIAQWFCTAFRPVSIDFETLSPNEEARAAGLTPPDPYEFARHCIRACRIIAAHGVQAVYSAVAAKGPRRSFCPVGRDTLIVSPDRRVSSCYLPIEAWERRGMNLDVGELCADGHMAIDMDAIWRLRQLVTHKPRCERCYGRWTCAGGCHVTHSYADCPDAYGDFCIQTRIIMACHLLSQLGFAAMADDLLEDPAAMRTLAMHPTDCLSRLEPIND